MKRLLRSCIDFKGEISPENLVQNFQKLIQSQLEWTRPDDARIFDFLKQYFQQRMELPSAQTVEDFFEKTSDVEAVERLKDVEAAPWYIRTNYAHLIQSLLEDQNRIKATALLREAHEIVNKGLVIQEGREKIRKQGVREGLVYFQQKAHDLIVTDFNARTAGDIRTDGQQVWDSYQDAKVNKGKVWGKFTGLNNIDSVSHGIKKGELWVHAAFPGELKCEIGTDTLYDHREKRRRTIEEIYRSGDLPIVTALYREGEEHRLVPAQVSHVVQNGVRDVFEVRLSRGRRVTVTANHKLYTARGWVETGDIKIGDWVATPKKMTVLDPRNDFTDAEVKFIGYMLGDGCFLGSPYDFAACNPTIQNDFEAILQDLGYQKGTFVDHHSTWYRERDGNKGWKFSSRPDSPAKLLARRVRLDGTNSYTKVIPDEFFGLPEDQVAILLGALWSTDGSCHVGVHERNDRKTPCRRTDISYASVSEDMCLGIQSLLLRLGIQSSVTKVDTTYEGQPYTFYSLRVVTRESKRTFAKLIKVVGKEEQFQQMASDILDGDDAPIPTALVPEGVKVPFGDGKFRYASQVRGRPSMTADTASLFREFPSVARVLDGDLAWDEVVSVTPCGQEMTYDLSVPNHHSFVANDIVTHNTTFALNWCYNLVTRYRSNVLYYSLEMPYEQLRLQIYVLHSSHAKFRNVHKPLDYRRVRDGELTPEEELFYQKVIDDFCNNPEYCHFEIRAPDRDMTITDIRMDAELTHKQLEIGLVVIDHGQLMEARKEKRSKDYTVELNSIIRDTKKFCLHFNNGEKIPTLMLFQINRQGKEEAVKNQGRYKMSGLAYANECIVLGTLVKTARGLIPIENVKVGDSVWSLSGWKPVLNTFNQGVRPTLRVQTEFGRSITVTPNHLLRVLEGGGVKWRRADEIVVGRDFLVESFGTRQFPTELPVLPALNFERYEKPDGMQGKPLVVPTHLTEDLAYLMGAYEGDGVAGTDYKVGFTGNRLEKTVRDRLMQSFERSFGHTLTDTSAPSRSGSFDLVKYSKGLKRWFMGVGMDRKPGVPRAIMEAPASCVIAYLRGFWDTDGSINTQNILSVTQKESNRQTLEEVQHLMADLGIETTLGHHTNTLKGKTYMGCYLRVRTQKGRAKFAQLIGFTEPHKQARLERSLNSRATERSLWPVGRLFLDVYDRHVQKPYGRSPDKVRFERDIREAARDVRTGKTDLVPLAVVTRLFSRLSDVQSDPDLNRLRELYGTIRPQRVMSIEAAGDQPVYDIEVTGDHEYVTAGFLSHNCEKSADVITTTYLDDEHRKNGTTMFCNLKNRDNPIIEPFMAKVEFACRRIYNLDAYQGQNGMSVDDQTAVLEAMNNL